MLNGTELVYTDGYSGKIYVADTTNMTKEKACYTAFQLDYDLMPPIDSTKFYTYEYVKPYWNLYYRCITDIRATDKAIYCIVNYGNDTDRRNGKNFHTLIVIDRKTGHIKEEILPFYEGYETWGYGLHVKNTNKVSPFVVLKKGSDVTIRDYFF